MLVRSERGQSTLEYAVLFAVIIAALIGMQVYMKRGTQGKLRESTDQIGAQFDPYSENYALTKTLSGTRTDDTTAVGTLKQSDNNMKQGRTGTDNPVDADLSAGTGKLF